MVVAGVRAFRKRFRRNRGHRHDHAGKQRHRQSVVPVCQPEARPHQNPLMGNRWIDVVVPTARTRHRRIAKDRRRDFACHNRPRRTGHVDRWRVLEISQDTAQANARVSLLLGSSETSLIRFVDLFLRSRFSLRSAVTATNPKTC